MTKAKTAKKSKIEKDTLINFRAKNSEMKKIKANAKKFADGNVSLWMRHAAMKYNPVVVK